MAGTKEQGDLNPESLDKLILYEMLITTVTRLLVAKMFDQPSQTPAKAKDVTPPFVSRSREYLISEASGEIHRVKGHRTRGVIFIAEFLDC